VSFATITLCVASRRVVAVVVVVVVVYFAIDSVRKLLDSLSYMACLTTMILKLPPMKFKNIIVFLYFPL